MESKRPARCFGCPFKSLTASWRGNPEADIAIVGESPGEEEVKAGKPFVGPSGQLLASILRKAGIDGGLDSCFVTNAISCYPGKSGSQNKLKDLPGAVLACQHRLHEELRHKPRKLVIGLGNAAVWSITGHFGHKITQIRGTTMQTEFGLMMPAIHPAALLRGTGTPTQLTQDIVRGIEEAAKGKRQTYIEPRWAVIDTQEKFEKLYKRFGQVDPKLVGADFETTGLDHLKDDAFVLGMCWSPDMVFILDGAALTADNLNRLFESKDRRWLWHNGKFDSKFAWKMGADKVRVDDDLMLLHYATNEISGTHGLEQVCEEYLQTPDYKGILKRYFNPKKETYADAPRPILYQYLARDVSYMLQAFNVLRPIVAVDGPLNKLYTETLIPASELLARVEWNGMLPSYPDIEANDIRLRADIDRAYQVIQERLRSYGWKGEEVNPNSPKQLVPILFDFLKIKTKVRSTDQKVLRDVKHPVVESLREYRKATKAHGTYVVGYQKAISTDGRIHTTFNLHVTGTGRLSSKKPNTQNMPRDPRIKGMIKARDGYVLMEFDYNQAELRTLAELSRDPWLMEVYEQGRKLHDEMSAFLFGKDYTDEQKVRAKAVNFGIPYGRESYSIAEEFHTTQQIAQSWIDDWFRRCPQAFKFIMACRSQAKTGKYIETPFGRRKRFHLVTYMNIKGEQNEAANFPIQSIASDLTLRGAVRANKRFQLFPEAYRPMIINLVHDSIVCEVLDDPVMKYLVAAIVIGELRASPKIHLNAAVPFDADAKIGTNWGRGKEYKLSQLQEAAGVYSVFGPPKIMMPPSIRHLDEPQVSLL